MALLALLLLSSIGLQLLNPQILRYFIDAATGGGSSQALVLAALAFLGIALTQQAGAVLATYLGENVGWTATNALRVDLAAHCLRLDLSFHKKYRPGELIERIDGDITNLSNFFSRFVIGLLGNVLLLLGVIALLVREDWRVGVVVSAFTLVALYLLTYIRTVSVPYWMAVREKSAQFFGFIGEHLAATEDLRANGATDHVMRRFYELTHEWFPLLEKAWVAALAAEGVTRGVFGMGLAMAFALGAYLWSERTLSLGTLYVIFYYIELIQLPLMQLRDQMRDLQLASASIARVQELFRVTSRVSDGVGTPLPTGALAVRFQQVSFAYEGDERVVHDVTFQLEPGQILGVLGRTGSGKTTLARLLFRLYDPLAGEIRLGGMPIGAASLKELRRHVGMVTQEVQLFDATLRENISFFDSSISDAQIESVLKELGLRRWLDALPAGLDTVLAGGRGLSAGEAQLVAFARVFMKSPGLVVLDEASAHLDPGTEALIERAVTRLLRERTGIVIAHRLATVQRADAILILEQGHIQEYGLRLDLLRDPRSHLAQLLQVGLDEVLA